MLQAIHMDFIFSLQGEIMERLQLCKPEHCLRRWRRKCWWRKWCTWWRRWQWKKGYSVCTWWRHTPHQHLQLWCSHCALRRSVKVFGIKVLDVKLWLCIKDEEEESETGLSQGRFFYFRWLRVLGSGRFIFCLISSIFATGNSVRAGRQNERYSYHSIFCSLLSKLFNGVSRWLSRVFSSAVVLTDLQKSKRLDPATYCLSAAFLKAADFNRRHIGRTWNASFWKQNLHQGIEIILFENRHNPISYHTISFKLLDTSVWVLAL